MEEIVAEVVRLSRAGWLTTISREFTLRSVLPATVPSSGEKEAPGATRCNILALPTPPQGYLAPAP